MFQAYSYFSSKFYKAFSFILLCLLALPFPAIARNAGQSLFEGNEFPTVQILKNKMTLVNKEMYTIAYFEGGPYWEFTEIYEEIKKNIESYPESFKLHLPEDKYFSPGWTTSEKEMGEIAQAIMTDPEIDLVVAMGTAASVALLEHNNPQKPVFSIDVAEPILAGLVNPDTFEPVASNFYVEYIPNKWRKSITLLDSLMDIKKIGTMSPPTEEGALYCNINELREVGRERGFQVFYYNKIDLEESVASCMQGIEALAAQGVESIYVPALTCFDPSSGDPKALYQFMHEKGITSYAKDGRVPVMEGALIGISTLNYQDIGAAFAQLIMQHFARNRAYDKRILLDFNPKIYINSATAALLGIRLPLTLLTNVDSIYDNTLPKITH